MATLIRLKRSNSSNAQNVVLAAGEPYYNTSSKRLYIGNEDDEVVDGNKKHIAQLTNNNTGDNDTIQFQVGEDEANTFSKTIDNVSNVTSTINGTPINTLFIPDPNAEDKPSISRLANVAYRYDIETEPESKKTYPRIDDTFQDIIDGVQPVGKLSTNAGNSGKPVYFTDGKPAKCDDELDVDISGNAESATKLETARDLITNLSSIKAASFNGTANTSIGVEGTLGWENGGTGAGTKEGAFYNLSFRGLNPSSVIGLANDTVTNWKNLGSGYVWLDAPTYGEDKKLSDMVSNLGGSHAFLINYVMGEQIFQLCAHMPNGQLEYRMGNQNGWWGGPTGSTLPWKLLLSNSADISLSSALKIGVSGVNKVPNSTYNGNKVGAGYFINKYGFCVGDDAVILDCANTGGIGIWPSTGSYGSVAFIKKTGDINETDENGAEKLNVTTSYVLGPSDDTDLQYRNRKLFWGEVSSGVLNLHTDFR